MNTWHLSYILKFFITNTRDRIFFDCQFLTLQTFYIAAGIQFLCWWRYCEFSLRYIPNINTIFIIIYTVESSLCVGSNFHGFRGNSCQWNRIPTKIKHKFVSYLLSLYQLSTHEITSPLTRKKLATHAHWPIRIKISPQYSCEKCLIR